MEKLSQLPNIEEKLEEKLILLGISTPGELKYIGSMEAFSIIRCIFPRDARLNLLYKIETALQGISSQQLDEEEKSELQSFYQLS